jgi:glutamate racemase
MTLPAAPLLPTMLPDSPASNAPVGVFDSGVGGLSVLRHIQALLPHEDLLYFADSAFNPYGDKSERWVVQRSLVIAAFLVGRGAKALVVACNTATVAAIRELRAHYPELPIVGVEPGLKPAAALTRSGKVGVLATRRTLATEKFLLLRDQVAAASKVEFLLQVCSGLADQIEKGELESPATVAMLEGYISPLLEQGADTLVLGSTHYPFARPAIESLVARATAAGTVSSPVTLVDTGEAVARQLQRLLLGAGLLRPLAHAASLAGFTSAPAATLTSAFHTLLGLDVLAEEVHLAGPQADEKIADGEPLSGAAFAPTAG